MKTATVLKALGFLTLFLGGVPGLFMVLWSAMSGGAVLPGAYAVVSAIVFCALFVGFGEVLEKLDALIQQGQA